MRLGWRKLLPASLVNILATGLLWLTFHSIGGAAERFLAVAGDVSMALVALLGLGAVVWFFVFMMSPPSKRKLLATSSAQFAALVGGTKTARMGA
jgi:hypothetical protein